jgi:predicted P-loop ATPase
MIVLESGQGTEKSSALEVLAVEPDWFSDALPLNADDKKVIETLAGRWIVEAAELKGMRKGDIEHLKAFLSRRIDRARMSYGRLVTEVPRQCVIIGTTNSAQYLRDSTGNRRFWPVRVERFDLTALRRDRDQLWAEAAQAEATGESIRLDPKLYSAAGDEQEERRIEDPWVGMIDAALGDLNGKVTVEDAWLIINVPEGVRTQEHNARLGDAMRELGWERTRRRDGGRRYYVYARGSAAERELWIRVTRDPETRQLDIELVTAEKQQEIEEFAAEAERQRTIPF